ncbi:MAG: cardiolipin synthase [Verrucomicrobia bacterium]|nr:MAG: cardiolipin synthase [Verrucomicrobiota bacterium]
MSCLTVSARHYNLMAHVGYWMNIVVSLVVALFQIAGIFCAIRAIMIARTPQAAIGWSVALIFLPYLAIPLFLVFGEAMFYGYNLAGAGTCPPLDKALQGALGSLSPYRKVPAEKYAHASLIAEKLRKLPPTQGNQVQLLIDSAQAFPAIFEAIDAASEYLIVQFYIIRDDDLGRRLKQKLIEAARRGVRIWILFDGMGSKQLPESYCEDLRRVGAEIHSFITNRQFGKRFQINFRNHRKLLIADGRVGYIGGLNIGDEYAGKKKLSPWRDTHIRVEGPFVNALQVPFVEDWYYITRSILPIPFRASPSPEGQKNVFLITSDPSELLQTCSGVYLELIHAAQRRLWIATPYLVPDYALRLALCHASIRGVDVRILLPQGIDHLLPWLSSFAYYPFWRSAGVKIYRYQPGFMHQKAMLIDDDFAVVGSINMDFRSFMLNFETAAAINDVDFAKDVDRMFQADFKLSKLENLESYEKGSFLFRLKVRFASLFSPEQ